MKFLSTLVLTSIVNHFVQFEISFLYISVGDLPAGSRAKPRPPTILVYFKHERMMLVAFKMSYSENILVVKLNVSTCLNSHVEVMVEQVKNWTFTLN